jgi:hypothetical protein
MRGFLGVLMLDTRFPRPVGDIGNPETFARAGIPVRYAIVKGASPQRVVRDADPALLQPFLEAAVILEQEGASLVTTSCGFLAAWQDALSRSVRVPVITSSLLQVKRCARPGIVTIAPAALTPAVLEGGGVPAGTPVEGVAPDGEFSRRILADDTTLDVELAAQDVVRAAVALTQRHPALTDIVLECTNMPPYRDAVARATGLPVHDIETLLLRQWACLARGNAFGIQSPSAPPPDSAP